MLIASIPPNRLIGCHKRRGCVRSTTLGCLHRATIICLLTFISSKSIDLIKRSPSMCRESLMMLQFNIPIENKGFQTLQFNKMTIFSIRELRRDFSITEGPSLSQSKDIVLLCTGIFWDTNVCRLQK